jgi:hypothetical protein
MGSVVWRILTCFDFFVERFSSAAWSEAPRFISNTEDSQCPWPRNRLPLPGVPASIVLSEQQTDKQSKTGFGAFLRCNTAYPASLLDSLRDLRTRHPPFYS